MARLVRSNTRLEDAERTPFAHRYLLKRPVINESLSTNTTISHTSSNSRERWRLNGETIEAIDNPSVERRRLQLFIDLIWGGIIGNLAQHFSEQAFTLESTTNIGTALGEFVLTFLIAWRMWKNLEDFMSKYHTNDLVERMFVIWILILAMLYGNNAPYILSESPDQQSNIGIVIYIISKASFSTIELAYSIHLPFQRRGILVRLLVALPGVGLWVGAINVPYAAKAGLLAGAVMFDFTVAALVEMPFFSRCFGAEGIKPFDADHWVERIQDFFIIILGEAVLNLVRGSPLGRGLGASAGTGVLALTQFYFLSGLYFNGDQSRTYIHAVKRSSWRKFVWFSAHTSMFHATIVLGVSVLFLTQHPQNNAIKPELPPDPSDDQKSAATLAVLMSKAEWCVSVSFSVTTLCLSIIALLSRSLDKPGTLKMTNRYIRLLPRLILIIVALCLPINGYLYGVTFLGILMGLLALCLLWEWFASLEREGGIFEP